MEKCGDAQPEKEADCTKFNSGNVENNWDELIVLDSDGVTNLNAAIHVYQNGQKLITNFKESLNLMIFNRLYNS